MELMKNKFYFVYYFLIINLLLISPIFGSDQFNFEITEIEIKEKGNKIYGYKRGEINTDSKIKLQADEFIYDKQINVLSAKGNIIIEDLKDNSKIFAEKITYFKNDEKIITNGKSKAIKENIVLNANIFQLDRNKNILIAEEKVVLEDLKDNSKIFAEKITYFKNDEKIITNGKSKAIKENIVLNANIFQLDRNKNILIAEEKVVLEDLKDNSKIFAEKITYFKNDEKIITNGKSKAIKENIVLNANIFQLDRNKNILIAEEKVVLEDLKDNSKIFAEKITYFKNDEKIITNGKSKSLINNKYIFYSKDLIYDKKSYPKFIKLFTYYR